jgi:hypothetical protein
LKSTLSELKNTVKINSFIEEDFLVAISPDSNIYVTINTDKQLYSIWKRNNGLLKYLEFPASHKSYLFGQDIESIDDSIMTTFNFSMEHGVSLFYYLWNPEQILDKIQNNIPVLNKEEITSLGWSYKKYVKLLGGN